MYSGSSYTGAARSGSYQHTAAHDSYRDSLPIGRSVTIAQLEDGLGSLMQIGRGESNGNGMLGGGGVVATFVLAVL
jgi:hypothetical protein